VSAESEPFLKAVEPYREDIVVAVECMFTWYWLADCDMADLVRLLGGYFSILLSAS